MAFCQFRKDGKRCVSRLHHVPEDKHDLQPASSMTVLVIERQEEAERKLGGDPVAKVADEVDRVAEEEPSTSTTETPGPAPAPASSAETTVTPTKPETPVETADAPASGTTTKPSETPSEK